MNKFVLIIIGIIFTFISTSCSTTAPIQTSEPKVYQKYRAIEIGQSRSEVQNVLGTPNESHELTDENIDMYIAEKGINDVDNSHIINNVLVAFKEGALDIFDHFDFALNNPRTRKTKAGDFTYVIIEYDKNNKVSNLKYLRP